MASFPNGKYGNMKPKEKSPLMKRQSSIAFFEGVKFIKDDDVESQTILRKLYGDKKTKYEKRRIKSRPLFVLWKNALELPEDTTPPWVMQLREIINDSLQQPTMKNIIKGGSFKDVVLYGSYAYSFRLIDTNVMSIREELGDLKDIINEVSKLPEFYRKRLNVPQSMNDVFSTPLILSQDVGQEVTVIITRSPLCSNGTLKNYVEKVVQSKPVRIQRFAQLVYEYTKVCRKLMEKKIFHIDIKPDNLFVCQGEKREIYAYGDVDGLSLCEIEDCNRSHPAATLFYEPVGGVKYSGVRPFANRDVYALMKTFLKTFFNLFYATGEKTGLFTNRPYDKGNGIPLRPHTIGKRRETFRDIDLAMTLLGLGRQGWKSMYNYEKGKAKKIQPYLSKSQLIVLQYLRKLIITVVNLMENVDHAFFEGAAFTLEKLSKALKKVQDLAVRVGAVPFEDPDKPKLYHIVNRIIQGRREITEKGKLKF